MSTTVHIYIGGQPVTTVRMDSTSLATAAEIQESVKSALKAYRERQEYRQNVLGEFEVAINLHGAKPVTAKQVKSDVAAALRKLRRRQGEAASRPDAPPRKRTGHGRRAPGARRKGRR